MLVLALMGWKGLLINVNGAGNRCSLVVIDHRGLLIWRRGRYDFGHHGLLEGGKEAEDWLWVLNGFYGGMGEKPRSERTLEEI